jgi:hypothetical protein
VSRRQLIDRLGSLAFGGDSNWEQWKEPLRPGPAIKPISRPTAQAPRTGLSRAVPSPDSPASDTSRRQSPPPDRGVRNNPSPSLEGHMRWQARKSISSKSAGFGRLALIVAVIAGLLSFASPAQAAVHSTCDRGVSTPRAPGRSTTTSGAKTPARSARPSTASSPGTSMPTTPAAGSSPTRTPRSGPRRRCRS